MPIERVSPIRIDVRGYDRADHPFLLKIEAEINRLVEEVNQAINAYHLPENAARKRDLLALIEEKVQQLDDAQSEDYVIYFPEYFEKIQNKLLREIQEEHALLDEEAGIAVNPFSFSLAEHIAHMSQEKVNRLMSVLLTQTGYSLQAGLYGLYGPGEEGKAEWVDFLDDHSVQPFASGNSKNFMVMHRDTREKQILKLETRLGNTREAESALRSSGAVAGVMTDVYVNRRSIADVPGEGPVTRNMQVTEFCSGKDIESYGASLKDNELRAISTAAVHIRMIEILEAMSGEGIFFPDIKSTNWLMDAKNRVRVSDGKSFLKIDATGIVGTKVPLIKTPYVTAPEMLEKPRQPFSADKAQAYMVGKNLYQYLTGCDLYAFRTRTPDGRTVLKHDARELDFSHAVFSTPEGAAFKEVIEKTVKKDPATRISLAEMKAEMQAIDPHYSEEIATRLLETMRARCVTHLKVLNALTVGDLDEEMDNFTYDVDEKLQQSLSLDDLLGVDEQLQRTYAQIKDVSSYVMQEVERLQSKSLNEEAAMLMMLVTALPLDRRAALLQPDTHERSKLIEVLESIELRERAKFPDDTDVSVLLHIVKEAKTPHIVPSALEAAITESEKLLKEIRAYRMDARDVDMERFEQELKNALPDTPDVTDYQHVATILDDILNDVEDFQRVINVEIQFIEQQGMPELLEAFKAEIYKTKIEERTQARAHQLVADNQVKLQEAIALRKDKAERESTFQMFLDLVADVKALGLKEGDKLMDGFIEDVLEDLDTDSPLKEMQEVIDALSKLLSDIVVPSSQINDTIKILLNTADARLQAMGKELSNIVVEIAVESRTNALFQNEKIAEILRRVADEEQTIGAASDALEVAKEQLYSVMYRIEGLRSGENDDEMDCFFNELAESLTPQSTTAEILEATEKCKAILADIGEVSGVIVGEVKALLATNDVVLEQLAVALSDAVAAIPVKERTENTIDNSAHIRDLLDKIEKTVQEKAVQRTQDFKQAMQEERQNPTNRGLDDDSSFSFD